MKTTFTTGVKMKTNEKYSVRGYRRHLVLISLLGLTQPVFATSVPGSGADQLVTSLVIALLMGGMGGVMSGVAVAQARRPVTTFVLSCLLVMVFAGFLSAAQGGGGEAILLSMVPYVPAFFVGLFVGRTRPKKKAPKK
jgi:peptidoglycan/LPS O-acetylase OafA/YrhL